jgi:hypothetical protein
VTTVAWLLLCIVVVVLVMRIARVLCSILLC